MKPFMRLLQIQFSVTWLSVVLLLMVSISSPPFYSSTFCICSPALFNIYCFLHHMLIFCTLLTCNSNSRNVYAFCNTHDVSWGTKGDNTMKTDLGVVKVGSDNKVEVDVPTKDEDIDHEYDRVLKILAKPRQEEKQKRDAQTKQEDYYKSFRTRVVLAWLISNLGLIIGILHTSTGLQGISVNGSQTVANVYLTVSMIPLFLNYADDSFVECCWTRGVPIYWSFVVFDFQAFPG